MNNSSNKKQARFLAGQSVTNKAKEFLTELANLGNDEAALKRFQLRYGKLLEEIVPMVRMESSSSADVETGDSDETFPYNSVASDDVSKYKYWVTALSVRIAHLKTRYDTEDPAATVNLPDSNDLKVRACVGFISHLHGTPRASTEFLRC